MKISANNWDAAEILKRLAGGADNELDRDLALRVYTSQSIGQQPDLLMRGGGNTSSKSATTDLHGNRIDVLCVKGSGWDLGTIEAPGLPAVRLGPLLALESLDTLLEDEMVNVQKANLLDPTAPDPSVERLPYTFLPDTFQPVVERQRVGQPEAVGSCCSGLWQARQARLLRIDHLHPQAVQISLKPVRLGSSKSGSVCF